MSSFLNSNKFLRFVLECNFENKYDLKDYNI